MRTSSTIVKIAEAILKAQKVIEGAKKESSNPFFKSSYADMNSVLEACKQPLNDNGISILQPVMGDFVQTILMHESGEWFMGKTRIINTKLNDPQAQGSAITYARRYGLQSMLGMMALDDDGEKAMSRSTDISKQATTDLGHAESLNSPLGKATQKQIGLIERLVSQKELPDLWLKRKGLESFKDIRFADVNKFIAELS